MEPKVGQIWQTNFADKKEFIFITNIRSNGFQVSYYFLSDPEEISWNYSSCFKDGVNYKLVSG